jgi:hypothetical protein
VGERGNTNLLHTGYWWENLQLEGQKEREVSVYRVLREVLK